MTVDEAKAVLAGNPTFDTWDETKRAWFCGRVVLINSAIRGMKGPNYTAPLAKLKSSLRKTIAMLEPFGMEVVDYLAEGLNADLSGALMELIAFKKTAKRLLAMPKPDRLIEFAGEVGYSGGDGPGGRRKWRNDVATQMVHELIKESGVKIVTVMGSPSMKLVARVLDCLERRGKPRKTETARKRLARSKGKNRREK
jgi:hypothetical protein